MAKSFEVTELPGTFYMFTMSLLLSIPDEISKDTSLASFYLYG